MKQGKLTNTQLKEYVLNKIRPHNAETIVGAAVGEDCCAIDTGGICVVSTDPITAAGAQAGELAIHINANDIASAGGIPVAALVTILIPPSAEMEQVNAVIKQITDTAASLQIDITGGHTEVTDSVNRIVVSVTMIGKPAVAGKVFKTADMKAGNDLVMTKYAGLEGTAIIAEDFADELIDVLDATDRKSIAAIKGTLSVLPEGVAAAKIPGVTAMHDITEGGVVGAVCEMCEASGTGALVDLAKVPVLDVTKKICAHYGIDVYGLISSGSMLIAAEDGGLVAQTLEKQGITASVIGRVDGSGAAKAKNGVLQPPRADELYKVIEKQR